MIKVKFSFLSLLADIIKEREIVLSIKEKSKIKEALIILSKKYRNLLKENILTSSETLNKYIILVLNGKDIRTLDNLNTLLHNGDEISFLPAIAGG